MKQTYFKLERISRIALWVFVINLATFALTFIIFATLASTYETFRFLKELILYPYGIIFWTSLGVCLFAEILLKKRNWDAKREQERAREREERKRKEEERRQAEKIAEAKRREASYWEGIIGNGKLFEREFAALWEKAGYKIIERSSGPDQGVDFIATKDEEKVVVQCKASKDKIGANDAIKLLGSVTKKEANRGVLASIGGFTIQAYTFAKGTKIELWGLKQIIELSTKTSSS